MRSKRRETKSKIQVGRGRRAEEFPSVRPLFEEAPSGARAIDFFDVPSLWLDRLLMLTVRLPLVVGVESVLEEFVRGFSDILGDAAVGICFIPPHPQLSRQHVVFAHVPDALPIRERRADSTRLFPQHAYERIEPIAGAMAGCTLHVAGEDPSLEDERSAVAHIMRRASETVCRAVDAARTYELLRTARDELRALEDRAIQADKLASFGQIAAGVVHELNNPLTSIVAYSDLLIRKAAAGDPDCERLSRINESAHRMLRFTRELTSYVRPASEVDAPVSLEQVIDRAAEFCEHLVLERQGSLEKSYEKALGSVRGSFEQLCQVFVNLFTNACHALPPEGGVIAVRTHHAHGNVVVDVEDNGHGISPQNLPHIFVPFFTTKGHAEGTGLGLSIVKSLVERHGGTISAASPSGSGTRFVLTFPQAR